jgi:DNA end-binding protein Ku
VELARASRPAGLGLRMLAADGTPLARRFVCPEDGQEVPFSELVRGFEHRPGEYIAITDEELAALEPDKSRDIDLRRFVPEASIDPIYFDRPFFLMPAGSSSKAYRLLATVMERERRAGIATFVMHDREHVVAIVARDGVLRAQLLRFAAEVRSVDDIGLPAKPKLPKERVRAFVKLIEKHTRRSVDLTQLEDETLRRTRALLDDKRERGRDVVQSTEVTSYEPAQAEIIDLMEILKQSLQKDTKKSHA